MLISNDPIFTFNIQYLQLSYTLGFFAASIDIFALSALTFTYEFVFSSSKNEYCSSSPQLLKVKNESLLFEFYTSLREFKFEFGFELNACIINGLGFEPFENQEYP